VIQGEVAGEAINLHNIMSLATGGQLTNVREEEAKGGNGNGKNK
jgi:hypothetical protein